MPEGSDSNEETLAGDSLHSLTGEFDTLAADDHVRPRQQPRATLFPLAPRIGRFSILRKLGEGGMGVVYAGYDEELDRKVAIKVLRGKAGGEGRKHRLVREAQGLARLSHPNVVQVYESGEQGDDAFIAMEYVDGTTLGVWLATPRTRAAILEVFLAAGGGLAAAHAKGLVHRDFKPDNVMITLDGRVLVMDFGLVHEASNETEAQAQVEKMHQSSELGIEQSLRISALSTDLTATGALMGTPAYMSPEQFIGHRTDPRTDQFAFCVALWEALCGERPYAGENFAALCLAVTQGQRREPPRGKLTRHLRKTLERGLAGKLEERWPSMDALLGKLRENPARRRTLLGLAAAPFVLALVGWQLWTIEQQAERDQTIEACASEAAAIAEGWTPATRSTIGAGFHATGLAYADDAWVRTDRSIDAYASEWSRMRNEACVATRVDAQRSEAEYADVLDCLDERRASLHAFIELLGSVDADIVNQSIQTASNLPALARCADAIELAKQLRPPEAQREAIARVRAGLGGVEVLIATRPKQARDKAVPLLDEALALGWGPLEAEARFPIADADYRLGKFDAAKPEFERTFLLAGELGHDRIALHAALALVELSTKVEDYPMAMHWAALASMFIRRLGLEQSQEAAQLETALGNVFNNQSKLPEAEAAHQRARAIWSALYGPEHYVIATAWANLGITQRRQGHYTEALASMQESLRIRELAVGAQHPRIAESVYNMGNVLLQLGRDDEALVLLERAQAIWTTAYGPRHRGVAFALNNIGTIHLDQGDLDRALADYIQARDIWIDAVGPQHSDVALAATNLGIVYQRLGRYDEALAAHQQSVAILEKAKGPDHPDLAIALDHLAELYRDRGELDLALATAERALAIFEKAYPAMHPDIAHGLLVRADVLVARGEPARARDDLERGLVIYEQREAAPRDRASVEFSLAKLEWAAGEHEQARAHARAARERVANGGGKELLGRIDAWSTTIESH